MAHVKSVELQSRALGVGGEELPFLTKLEKMPYVLQDELIHIF